MATNPGDIVLGSDAKVRVNGTPFAVTKGSAKDAAARHAAHDTESAANGKTRTKAGLRTLSMNFTLREDKEAGTYALAPLNIKPGSIIDVKLYPRGLDDEPYACQEFQVLEWTHNIDVDNPNDIQFSGENWGDYTVPGE